MINNTNFAKLNKKQNTELHKFINLEVYKLCGNKRKKQYLKAIGKIEFIDVDENTNNLIAIIKGKSYSFNKLYCLVSRNPFNNENQTLH